jgi:ectoine hydroxylase-related dioxygenase (phytanoyl-CoA dioxygenase family)
MNVTLNNPPEMSEDYALFDSQIKGFRKNGHVLLRGVATPEEVAAYRPILSEAVERYKTEARPMEERDTYGKAFLQVMNLWRQEEGVRRYVFARRFAKIAADLMGVKGVRLYHDQALYKEPHGGHTPWHQDQYYWPFETEHTITMWMPLVDVPIEMGALTFASGSNAPKYQTRIQISDESEEQLAELVKREEFPIACEAMKAGDATFHAGWTMHNAPGNQTDRMREVMTVIYFADGARIIEPDNPNRQNDLDSWLPGQKPGELAASPLNPVLFHR